MATKAVEPRARRYDPAETRMRVLEAANELFSQLGFAKTGTADIARAAGVSEGSIFYHFGSKGALMEELGRQYGERMIAAMQGSDELHALDPSISITRCFDYCAAQNSWENLAKANSPDGTKHAMSGNPDAEPFYRASREVVVAWCVEQYQAMKEERGLTEMNAPIAAALTYSAVGDALDLAFAEGTSDERREEVKRETIRFVCAACGVDCSVKV